MENIIEPGYAEQQEQHATLPQQSFHCETTRNTCVQFEGILDEGEYSLLLSSLKDCDESCQDQGAILDPNPVPIATRRSFCSSISLIDDDGIQSLLYPSLRNNESNKNAGQIEEVTAHDHQKKRKLPTFEHSDENECTHIDVKKPKSDLNAYKTELHDLNLEECINRSSCTSSQSQTKTGRWTDKEHALFLRGLEFFGKGRWAMIAKFMKTRTHLQVRTHAQKYFKKISITGEKRKQGNK